MNEKSVAEQISELLKSYGLPVASLVIIFIALWKPENLKLYASWFWYFVSKGWLLFRKKSVALGVEALCTQSLKKFRKEIPEVKLPGLNISWATEANIQSVLQSGKAIVKLKYSLDHSKNLVAAVSEYVKVGVLYKAKPFIEPELRSAIDFSITKKLLMSYSKYRKEYVTLFLNENPIGEFRVQEKCSQLEDIDDAGLFTRIVIRELENFGDILTGRLPKEDYKLEAQSFVNYVSNIATREYDEQTNLLFENQHLNVAVILVAKPETYYTYGVDAYLRRIKLCLTKGVENYYLLARNESVKILKKVAAELFETGYFIIESKPHEFSDSQKRNALCYYIRINKDSLLSSAHQNINKAQKENTPVQGFVTRVSSNYIKVDVSGIEGIVNQTNLSSLRIDDARIYFNPGVELELHVLAVLDDGTIELSNKETKSDPFNYFRSNFVLGSEVTGKVTYCDDDFIKIEIKDHPVEGIAFRKDLTFSKYIFLHKKYTVGNLYSFIVRGYDFDEGRIVLKSSELSDPWDQLSLKENQQVNVAVTKKTTTAIFGELMEGVEVIIFNNEIDHLEKDALLKKEKIKLNEILVARAYRVNSEKRLVYASLKSSANPYKTFFDKNKGSTFPFEVVAINSFGIEGIVNKTLKIFIPKSLQSWNKSSFKYKVGARYKVYIKDVNDGNDSLIGSFKEFLLHPLQAFIDNYNEGDEITGIVNEIGAWGAKIEYKAKNTRFYGILFNNEVTDLGFIPDLEKIFRKGEKLKTIIKLIDLEKSRIIVSLKQLTKRRKEIIVDDIDYDEEFDAKILAKKGVNYVVYLPTIDLDGILETNENYQIGANIRCRAALIRQEGIILTDN